MITEFCLGCHGISHYYSQRLVLLHCQTYYSSAYHIALNGGPGVYFFQGWGIGPPASVLARPVFSQGKNKILFLQKVSNRQSASVIWDLLGLLY